MHYNPVIIATDTNPPSKLARTLAAVFQARLSKPKHSLTIFEKARLTEPYSCENRHEKDALAAALKAYHEIENKLRQVQKHAREKALEPVHAQVAVLRGTRMSDMALLKVS